VLDCLVEAGEFDDSPETGVAFLLDVEQVHGLRGQFGPDSE